MVKEMTYTLIEKLELTNYSSTFPQVLDDLYSADANFEMISSNTIQKLKIFYRYNIVTHQIAIIFVHGICMERSLYCEPFLIDAK